MQNLPTLAHLDRAKLALAEARTLDDVTGIRDQAEALRVCCRAAGQGIDIQNLAAEIKIRAEVKAGEMLAAAKLNGGDRKSELHHARVKLADVGISETQSHRWQRMALVPPTARETLIREAVESHKELTSASLLKLSNQFAPKNGAKKVEAGETTTCTDLAQLDGQKFGCIYADPPWQYQNQGTRASTDNHYSTMTVDDICKLPIGELAADKAHLHLWTTNAFLFECPKIFAAWGFEFKSSFVWVKPQMGIGNYWRNSHEILLLAVRGGQTSLSKAEKSWVLAKRGSHSAKPWAVRDSIKRLSPGPYLELFGRYPVEGWTVFGNEVATDILIP